MSKQQKTPPAMDQPAEARFTKSQLIESKTLGLPRDAAAAVLEDGQTYTKDQAKTLVLDFLKRKV